MVVAELPKGAMQLVCRAHDRALRADGLRNTRAKSSRVQRVGDKGAIHALDSLSGHGIPHMVGPSVSRNRVPIGHDVRKTRRAGAAMARKCWS